MCVSGVCVCLDLSGGIHDGMFLNACLLSPLAMLTGFIDTFVLYSSVVLAVGRNRLTSVSKWMRWFFFIILHPSSPSLPLSPSQRASIWHPL